MIRFTDTLPTMMTVGTSERLRCWISFGGGNGPLARRHRATFSRWSAHMALLPKSETGIVVLTNANLMPCGAFMKLAVQHRLVELLYGMENQIDGYLDQLAETVRDAFGIEC